MFEIEELNVRRVLTIDDFPDEDSVFSDLPRAVRARISEQVEKHIATESTDWQPIR
jgi:hypothetical protein